MNCGLKSGVLECTPHSVVHVEVIQVIRWTSAVNLSYDRIDILHVRYNCWRHENYVVISCFQHQNSLNFLNFWTQQVSPSRVKLFEEQHFIHLHLREVAPAMLRRIVVAQTMLHQPGTWHERVRSEVIVR